MHFPDWFLKQLRERVSIADYAGKRLVWDRRKSRPSAGDFWAPCPFHTEKSASFHVRDKEAVFKCFGCGEGGDVFTLCQKLEGLDFGEAVARLAADAGMEPPRANEADRRDADRRGKLYATLAAAQTLFESALRSSAGAKARAYLDNRGLNEDVRTTFGIGFAPDGWTGLIDALCARGFSLAELTEAGLAKAGGRNGAIDVFRNRITFPIADAQGRIIAFGGRAMAADEPAKYLNSPETPLFKKGETLYRLKPARELMAKTKAAGMVVCEGYLDVIAFERAGIPAVAPLGTALTEAQLALLWRFGGAPVLCFDGDAAGARAARRTLDLALPEFGPSRTLQLITLPPGHDPDDVYRASGPAALAALIAAAQPAVEALFAFEVEARALTTPEARADLKRRLAAAAGRIKDEETKRQYARALSDKAFQAFAPPPRAKREDFRGAKRGDFKNAKPPDAHPTAELKAMSPLARFGAADMMVRIAVDFPEALDRGSDLFAAVPLPDQELDTIRHAVLDLWCGGKKVDRETVSHHLGMAGQDRAQSRLLSWPVAAKSQHGRSGGRGGVGPSASDAEPARLPVPRSGTTDLAADATNEIEAEWMALLTLDVTAPNVREELQTARACDLDADDEAFAAAEAALRSRRDVHEAALRRGLNEPDAPISHD
jgi:DNA primase